MGYLKEFLTQIKNRDFHKFLVLWEEYSSSESVKSEEFSQLLKAIKGSDLAIHFGQIVETAFPLWQTIQNSEESYEILRLLIDIQTTNSPLLADVTLKALKKKYGQDPKFEQKLRIIGLQSKDSFQGALSKYDLFEYMRKGNIVFHTGGWGTGEIVDVSHIREHLTIEFENVSGKKDLSFINAFKTLIPLPTTHFLAKRFSDPDSLEKIGTEDPIALIQLLLHDMGPQTASEIKDQLCELVIPEEMWTKWWQGARAKIKKHPLIETPDSIKEQFHLRQAELSPKQRLDQVMKNKTDVNDIIQTCYNFVRDAPEALKNPEIKQSLLKELLVFLDSKELKVSQAQQLQLCLLLEQSFNYPSSNDRIIQLIQSTNASEIEAIVNAIDIIAFKKKALLVIKDYRSDWKHIFLNLFFILPQVQSRDYILRELLQENFRGELEQKLKELIQKPSQHPETFVWYFQKLISSPESDIPFQSHEGKNLFFETFFILFSEIESKQEYRELIKKMYGMITSKRYQLIRELLQTTSVDFAKEFLLLISKCQSLNDHDIKILRSLVEVVHPSLALPKHRGNEKLDNEEIWTTESGYLKVQERIRHIGTVEVIENAREIEAARALGDLRENSEFKFAQERRSRLQSELKSLSDQLSRARIITPDDIHIHEVGIGNSVNLKDSAGNEIKYLILGPWDANPDENILSFNSKLALAIIGKKLNDTFNFRDENYQILHIGSYFTK